MSHDAVFPPASADTALTAVYYDGQSSRRYQVAVRVDETGIMLTGDGIVRHASWAECEVSERTRHGPRIVRFEDDAQAEIADGPAFDIARQRAGHRDSAVVKWQQSWRVALLAIAGCVFSVFVAYQWGLPWAANVIAQRLPDAVYVSVGNHAMNSLDEALFKPSKLDPARAARLQERFELLSAQSVPGELLFRDGGRLGANALALPSGKIVVTDQLAAILDDDQIVAVMAHELGHVAHQHGMRAMLQNSVVGIVAAWYLNDLSAALGGAVATFSHLQYSRGFEYDADEYGARLLHKVGMSPRLLGTALDKLSEKHGRSGSEEEEVDYLSTHPGTSSRMRRIEELEP